MKLSIFTVLNSWAIQGPFIYLHFVLDSVFAVYLLLFTISDLTFSLTQFLLIQGLSISFFTDSLFAYLRTKYITYRALSLCYAWKDSVFVYCLLYYGLDIFSIIYLTAIFIRHLLIHGVCISLFIYYSISPY